MSLETALYDRLTTDSTLTALLSTRVYPDRPTHQTPTVPYLVYGANALPSNNLDGTSTTVEYSVTLDVWAKKKSDTSAVLDALQTRLNGWSGGNVEWSCFQSENTDQQHDDGYHGSQTYQVLWTAANIVADPDSTGWITTGPDEVVVTACDRVLRLDCDVLTLDGDTVGSGGGGGTVAVGITTTGSPGTTPP